MKIAMRSHCPFDINNKCYIGIYEYRKTKETKEVRIIEDKVP